MIPIVRPSTQPQRESQATQTAHVLHRLNNLLEYTVGDVHTLVTLRGVTPTYIKAISSARRTEFYFPCRVVRNRSGGMLQILSVLRREASWLPVKFDADGLPIENCKLIDDMKHHTGKVWRYGIQLNSSSLIYTAGKPGL
jgi:hypothetical protein